MADEKTTAPVEEVKWWIDRGPVKEREKQTGLDRGIIEKWTYELLKDYRQEQAVKNVVDINPRTLKDLSQAPLGWIISTWAWELIRRSGSRRSKNRSRSR